MNNFQKQNWQNTENQQAQQQANFQAQTNSQNQQVNNQEQPSWMMEMVGACLPVLMKKFAGLNMPAIGNPNIQLQPVLSQAITLLQQIANNQQNLDQRMVRLENRASQQFNGLSQQIQNFKGIRLSHEREKKQIELHGNVSDFDKSRQFNNNSNFQPKEEY